MSGSTGLSDSQMTGLGTSGAAMGAGAALAPVTGGASMIPGGIMMGGQLLGDIMGNGDQQAQQSAQQQAQMNAQQSAQQQNTLAQMDQSNPYAMQLMNSGNQYEQIPMSALSK